MGCGDEFSRHFPERPIALRFGGCVLLYWPDHPNASTNGLVLEHVAVAARALGRPLNAPECVYHVNGDTADNRPENLVICPDDDYRRLLHERHDTLREALDSVDPDGDKYLSPEGRARLRDAVARKRAREAATAFRERYNRVMYAALLRLAGTDEGG